MIPQPFGKHIWTFQQRLRFFGLQIGARMTVVDITGEGDLWIHSPIALTPPLRNALAQLGSVRHVVAPNCWHHFFVADFKQHYPEATFWCAPGLETKRQDLQFDHVLTEDSTYPWSQALKHQLVRGCPRLNEVVFLHPTSQTLIVTDLGLHIGDESPLLTRLVFRLMGTYRTFGWTSAEKLFLIRNKQAFSDSMRDILKWEFENLILAHGRLITGNGKILFQRAFAP